MALRVGCLFLALLLPALAAPPAAGSAAPPPRGSGAAPAGVTLGERVHAEPGESPPLWKVKLTKQYVPVHSNNNLIAYKTAYSGQVYLGYPEAQVFTVVFDTGSAHFFIPAVECDGVSCANHACYNRSASTTAIDINDDGSIAHPGHDRDQVAVTYGTGEVSGEFVQEIACLRMPPHSPRIQDQHICARLRVITAQKMSKDPFSAFSFDGVLGLGLSALALHPEFSFIHQLTHGRQIAPVFAIWLSRSDDVQSEITFGGWEKARSTGEMSWVPVASPQLGYWQVKVHGVSVAGRALDLCTDGTCTAVLDSGTSLLGVPTTGFEELRDGLSRFVPGRPKAMDCRDFPGPPLAFDLGDGLSIELGASDYSRPAAALTNSSADDEAVICRPSLLPIEVPALGPMVFLMGEPVLRRYYTAYDTTAFKVGFAGAAHPSTEDITEKEVSAALKELVL